MKYKVKYRVIGPDQIKRKYLINLEEGAVFPLTRELLEGKKLSPGDSPTVLCDLTVREAQLYVVQSNPGIAIRLSGESGPEFAVKPGDLMDVETFTFEFLEAPFINHSSEETRFVDVVEMGQHLASPPRPSPGPAEPPPPSQPAPAPQQVAPPRSIPQGRPTLRIAPPPPSPRRSDPEAGVAVASAIHAGASAAARVLEVEPAPAQTKSRTLTRNRVAAERPVALAPVAATPMPRTPLPADPPAPQSTGPILEDSAPALDQPSSGSAGDSAWPENPNTGFTSIAPPIPSPLPSLTVEEPGQPRSRGRRPTLPPDADAAGLPDSGTAARPDRPHPEIPRHRPRATPRNPGGPPASTRVPTSPFAARSPDLIEEENPSTLGRVVSRPPREDGTIVEGLTLTRTHLRESLARPALLNQPVSHVGVSLGIALLSGMAFGYLASMSLEIDTATLCVIAAASALLTSIAAAASLFLNNVLEMEAEFPEYCRFFAWVATGAVPFSYFFKFPPGTTLLGFAVGMGLSILAFERNFRPNIQRYIGISGACALLASAAALIAAPVSWQSLAPSGRGASDYFVNLSPHASESLLHSTAPEPEAEEPAVQAGNSARPQAPAAIPAPPPPAVRTVVTRDPALIRQYFQSIKEGDLSQVENLVDRRFVSPAATLNGGQNGLMLAVAFGRLSVAEYLLARGINVNAQDDEGSTALMWAIARHHPECVRLLLRTGANTAIRRRTGDRAIDLARRTQQQELVRLLMSVGSR